VLKVLLNPNQSVNGAVYASQTEWIRKK